MLDGANTDSNDSHSDEEPPSRVSALEPIPILEDPLTPALSPEDGGEGAKTFWDRSLLLPTARVGITYDLRVAYLADGYSPEQTAEFDSHETIDAIENALVELGYLTDRIGNVRQLVARLAQGDRWDVVFNICEGMHGLGREALVPALLDAYEIPYTFADPCTLTVSLHKGLAKMVVRAAGLPTPHYMVTDCLADLENWEPSFPFPMFVKPVGEGTGKGVSAASRVVNRDQLLCVAGDLLRNFQQPIIVEEYLPGREFTVGIWGSGHAARVIGTMEIILLDDAEPGAYTFVNKERCEEFVKYRTVLACENAEIREVERVALEAWRALEGRDAGRIDLRVDGDGKPQFLEANPLAGLHPHHSDLPMLCEAAGICYIDLIREIVESARCRIVSPTRPNDELADCA